MTQTEITERTAKPAIDLANEDTARELAYMAVCGGILHETYQQGGALVHLVQRREGVRVQILNADMLSNLLADALEFQRRTKEATRVVLPPDRLSRMLLQHQEWGSLPELRGVSYSPFIRPDGSVCATRGYDEATGIWCDPLGVTPEHATALEEVTWDEHGAFNSDYDEYYFFQEVMEARKLLFDDLLRDFPWKNAASRANFIALLFTPLLRNYVSDGTPTPLGIISATERGSGKTLLADEVIGRLYGNRASRPWVNDDDEIRKAITALLTGSSPVVTLDNVGNKQSVKSPTFAKLLTAEVWTDRLLGTSTQLEVPNNRLWLVTGNNVSVGEDIAPRVVLVELDPRSPHPEKRKAATFALGDLSQWMRSPAHRLRLLSSMIVLVKDWVREGSRTADTPMRGYTSWASSMSGFLAHMQVRDFLGNPEELKERDDEAEQWEEFVAAWFDMYPDREVSCTELHQSSVSYADRWDGAFLTDWKGNIYSAHALATMIGKRTGRYFGPYVIRRRTAAGRKKFFKVEKAA